MSILKNWKQNRSQRIEAAKLRASGVAPVKKVDPRAQAFLDEISKSLESSGISDKKQRDQCSFDLFQITIKTFDGMLHDSKVEDAALHAMAEVLARNGIADETAQELIILDYFMALKEMGETT